MTIEIRKGGAEEISAFASLLENVHREMSHPEWFYVDPPEVFRELYDSGKMEYWLALDGQTVAAAFDLLIPGLDPCNYGYALDFTREQLLQVVNMDSVAVHPDYRGKGLQRRLLREAEDWLGREENRILLCTVHPENRYSLENALAQGYTIEKKISIYGSVRYLLRKNIRKKKNRC